MLQHYKKKNLLTPPSQVSLHRSHPAVWRPQLLLPPQGQNWTGHIPQRFLPRCSQRPSDARSRGEPVGRPQRCEAERRKRRRTTGEEEEPPTSLLRPSLYSLHFHLDASPPASSPPCSRESRGLYLHPTDSSHTAPYCTPITHPQQPHGPWLTEDVCTAGCDWLLFNDEWVSTVELELSFVVHGGNSGIVIFSVSQHQLPSWIWSFLHHYI